MKSYIQIKKEQKAALDRLLEYSGTQTRLAKNLGLPVQTVAAWFQRGRISATAAIEVENLTKGYITKEELRPDVESWSA